MTDSDRPVRGILRKIVRRLTIGDGVPLWLAVGIVFIAADALTTQARTLGFPLIGEHRWREADTYAVAYDFVHESFDFFHPRSDLTRGRTGIMGMEPPVYPFVTALAMKVFGDAPAVGRVIVWLTEIMGLAALLALMRRVRDTGLALGFLLAFTLSPLALFELRQIQPDGPTGMFAAVAAFFLYRFAQEERRRDYVMGIAAYAIAVLLKGPGFCFAPAMLWFACAARPVTFKQFFKRGLGVAFAVALYIPWYKWAHYLTDHYNAGIKNFGIDFTFHGIRDALLDQDRLHNVFWFVIPSYSSNWVLFPAFLAGLPAAFQRKTRRVSTAFLLWLVFGALFLACFNTHLDSHWYYANLVLVPMAYFAATAISEALRLFAKGPHRASLVSRWAVLVVMVTLVLQRFIAPLWHKSSETVAAAGPHPEGSWMSEGHLTLLLCLLMLTMILAQRLTLKWLRVVAIVLLPFAAYLGIGRARRNALGVLRWRTHSSDERQFKERWINTLRPTVDRYSTRKDLFVMNIPDGTIGQDPFPLYLAMRKGWSEDADSIKNNGMAFYRKGGARFFLTYASAEVPEEKGLTKLAGTDYFRLYCIDPNGCEPLTPASP